MNVLFQYIYITHTHINITRERNTMHTIGFTVTLARKHSIKQYSIEHSCDLMCFSSPLLYLCCCFLAIFFSSINNTNIKQFNVKSNNPVYFRAQHGHDWTWVDLTCIQECSWQVKSKCAGFILLACGKLNQSVLASFAYEYMYMFTFRYSPIFCKK